MYATASFFEPPVLPPLLPLVFAFELQAVANSATPKRAAPTLNVFFDTVSSGC
jgi:hypothetical protein